MHQSILLWNILHLSIDYCDLSYWTVKGLESLCFSFRKIASILYLNIGGNSTSRFTAYSLKNFIMILRENLSLRYVVLAIPKEELDLKTYENFIAEINEVANENRGHLLYVSLCNVY